MQKLPYLQGINDFLPFFPIFLFGDETCVLHGFQLFEPRLAAGGINDHRIAFRFFRDAHHAFALHVGLNVIADAVGEVILADEHTNAVHGEKRAAKEKGKAEKTCIWDAPGY